MEKSRATIQKFHSFDSLRYFNPPINFLFSFMIRTFVFLMPKRVFFQNLKKFTRISLNWESCSNMSQQRLQSRKYLFFFFPSLSSLTITHDKVSALGDTVAATITVQHLELTIDDVAGKNHHFCKPIAKFPHDREAIRRVVKEGMLPLSDKKKNEILI